MLALDSVPSYDRETDASLAISCKLIYISIASIVEFGLNSFKVTMSGYDIFYASLD